MKSSLRGTVKLSHDAAECTDKKRTMGRLPSVMLSQLFII
jgi:hypothetical protein